MRYFALACDYDGTLAWHGSVDEATLEALERVKHSGRYLLLVSGRELEDLQRVFSRLDVFDLAVLENGALLYRPATGEERLLGEAPPPGFAAALRERGVDRFSVGRAIVATWRPHETAVLEAIRDLGIERQVIFNKDAVMVLPSGVNKASGLRVALQELGLSSHNVVGIGDAENDHAFLSFCECAVAVDNALPALKERADLVTGGHHGPGVIELVEQLLVDDLASLEPRLARHGIPLGTRGNDDEVRIRPYGASLLIAGPPRGGKARLAARFLERLAERCRQFCVIDPNGDYLGSGCAVALGDARRPPILDDVLEVLRKPDENVVVNLIGLPAQERSSFATTLVSRLQDLRARTGRPHWILIGDAHELLPSSWEPGSALQAGELTGLALVTEQPGQIAPSALSRVDPAVAVGERPELVLRAFADAIGQDAPNVGWWSPDSGEALAWFRGHDPIPFRMPPAPAERRRQARTYADGNLAAASFYFRGPQGRLNLRAQNLTIFNQLAEGVDDDTWRYHLERGDYARWFRETIGDEHLAGETARIARRDDLSPAESRALILQAIERRYIAPTPTGS